MENYSPTLNEQKTRLWAMSYDRRSTIVCCENCGTINKVVQLAVNNDVLPERRLAPLVPVSIPAPEQSQTEAAAESRLQILKTELDQLGLKVIPKLKNNPESQKRLKNAAACALFGLVTVLLFAKGKHRS